MTRCVIQMMKSHSFLHQVSLWRVCVGGYYGWDGSAKWAETCSCEIYVHFVHKLGWVLTANFTLLLILDLIPRVHLTSLVITCISYITCYHVYILHHLLSLVHLTSLVITVHLTSLVITLPKIFQIFQVLEVFFYKT